MRAILPWLFLAAGLAASAARPSSPVADAAERADWGLIPVLLRQGSRADVPQADGMTALHWAAHLDHVGSATLLIQSGASATATNRYGVAPLSLACVNGSTAMVTLLLNAGADPNTTLHGGETALMTAARTGRPGPVKALLSHGAKADARELRGQTALMWAAAEGHAGVVDLLLKAGADFRTPLPDSGFTPLLFAVREGRTEAVRVLLSAGQDVNQAMEPRKTSGKGPRKGTSPLLLAVENGHFDLADVLLKAGADPNDQRSGFTPLHALTWVRKPNRGDGDDGDPAPIGSGRMNSLQFARRLVAHGANINARLERGHSGRGVLTRKGATPFLLAAVTADVAYMRLLLESGADPSIPNADGATPLMAAAGLGCLAPTEEAGTEPECLEAVRFLVGLGANVNAVDANGETAIHGAAYKNLPEVVTWLAGHGADVTVWNRTNRWGWTPLRIAEGYRVGNFKPSFETVAAMRQAMLNAGVQPPPSQPQPAATSREPYPATDAKKQGP